MMKPRIAIRWWMHRLAWCAAFVLAGSWAFGGEGEGQEEKTPNPETFYVAMWGTQQTKLRGKNPVVGIFLTQDRGKTWRHIGWEQGKANAVTTVPGSGGSIVFVAGGNGVLRTTEGGRSWQIVTDWRMDEVQDVAVNPCNPRQVFAVSPYGIFRSDDGGDTWAESDDGAQGMFCSSIRFDRVDPERMWVGTHDGLYGSDDGGRHWRATEIREPVRCVRQSPVVPDQWAIATVGRGVAVSDDNGATWRFASDAMPPTIYQCEFDPHESRRLYAGGWETGLLISDDLGRSWRVSRAGLGPGSVHGIAVSRQVAGLILVGTLDDGVFRSADDGRSWQPVGDGIFVGGQIWDIYVEGEL